MPVFPFLALAMLQMSATGQTTLAQDRQALCQEQARRDPAAAILEASQWEAEATGAERSLPRQCLGMAYTSLLRWEAAEMAFLAARGDLPADGFSGRARLSAMAGQAAMAGGRAAAALDDYDLAMLDLARTDNPALLGEIAMDRARALVALNRLSEAAASLATARTKAPQLPSAWLLSATLARRMQDLHGAQALIETAASLAPADPAVGLEAGVIAVLSGREGAARNSWQSVIDTAPDAPEAAQARTYLGQLQDMAGQ